MAAPLQNEVGPKESFYRNFQRDVTALQAQMECLSQISTSGSERNDALDNCLAGIDKLSHEVKDASSYLPAYDQRTHSEAIKALSEKLQNIRNSFNPPKKFSFKARKSAPAKANSDATEISPSQKPHATVVAPVTSFPRTPLEKPSQSEGKEQQEATQENGEDDIGPGPGIRRPSFSKSTQVAISKHSGLHIILSTSASHATSAGTVSQLHRCVVDLSPSTTSGAPFAALYVKDIKDSLIICGQVAGAIHVTNVENSVIVTACRQFRMHGAKDVDIYLHSASRPIFEDCEGLRFAPLPAVHTTPAMAQTTNHWDQIDDFKWLKAEPSPHFSILPESQRVIEEVWRDKVPGGDSVSLEDILKTVGVRSRSG
ncbi:TBCC-domain-containing protein [Clathrospora elynae]|uniref:TBCC-domain-containing protein n=1 Tax=Clathrospora elynae TaxID=706981 RepID=A0A6A5T6Q1_9PLEO|nr:TBCC-domain-containing protein [Clathrospora elynae]